MRQIQKDNPITLYEGGEDTGYRLVSEFWRRTPGGGYERVWEVQYPDDTETFELTTLEFETQFTYDS